jgi:hypothetical protein
VVVDVEGQEHGEERVDVVAERMEVKEGTGVPVMLLLLLLQVSSQ